MYLNTNLAEKKLEQLSKAVIRHDKIEINKYSIHYIISGKGEPLLLIHGANIGWAQWYRNIASLSKLFTVYAIDLPGSGNSTKIDYENYDIEDAFVKTVKDFIILKKLSKLNIVGHSIGGFIALKLAFDMKDKIKKIVLVNPIGLIDYMPISQLPLSLNFFAKFLTKTALKPTRKNIGNFLRSVLLNKEAITEEFITYYHANITRDFITHPIMLMHSLIKGTRMKRNLVLKDKLTSVFQPTLIILGDSDKMIPSDKVVKAYSLIPNFEVKVYENTGHVPSLEQSDRFNKDILKFLRK